MTRVLTDAEMFGPVPSAPGETRPAKVLTDAEMFGGMSDAITRGAMEQKSAWGQTKAVAKDLAGYGLGTIGQIEDMFLAIPRVLSIPKTTGIAIGEAAAGASSKEISEDMLKAQEEFMPAWTQGVFGKIAEALGPKAREYYDQNGLGRFMQMFGEKAQQLAEKGEDFGLPKELTTVALNNAMDIFATKGIKEGVKAGMRKRGAAEEARQSERFAERQKAVEQPVPEEPAAIVEPTKAEVKELRKAVKELDVTPDKLKEMFDKGEVPEAGVKYVKDLFDKAKQRGGGTDTKTFVLSMGALGVGAAAAFGLWDYFTEQEEAQGETAPATPSAPHRLPPMKEIDPGVIDPKSVPWQNRKPEKLWASLDELGAAGIGAAMAAGAVKGVGDGVWTKGAVERLSKPLSEKLASRSREHVANIRSDQPIKYSDEVLAQVAKDEAIFAHSDRMVTKHLNKYFGSETDPLNSVKIPMLGDEVTWGQVADAVVKSAKIPERLRMMKSGEAMKGEAIWDVEPDAILGHDTGRHFNALQSYLSHAGDFAREFIPPEKLGQYDLVRLIKETAAQDAKQAAKMAKARASGEGTTPYKTYPDGMKWVEVKSADALRNEGDVMGHCVGGYCEAVHNGESKIYSLRDAKGMSHVTVEVAPRTENAWRGSALAGEFWDKAGKDYQARHPQVGGDAAWSKKIFASPEYKAWIAQEPAEILQIKGKQNRAPVAAYLPYVQDFVKSGKWGEVGDLQNTGLIRGSDIANEIYHRKLPVTGEALRARGLKPDQYYTRAEIDNFVKGDGVEADLPAIFKNQAGSVDPELLARITAIGGGAAAGMAMSKLVDPEHPLRDGIYGALAGAAFGTPGGRALVKRIVSSPDEALGLLSTRLGNIAPELKFALRNHEMRVLRTIDKLNDQVLPFLSAVNGLPDAAMAVAKRALLNGDIRTLGAIPELRATFPAVAKVLGGIEEQLQSLGRFQEGVTNYFPRIVRDFEGLKKAIGQEATQGLEAMLVKAEAKSIRQNGRGLSDIEQSIIVNRYLFSQDKSSFQPGYAKARRMGEVPEELAQFYEAPQESLLRYLSGAVNDIETARFFGRDLKSSKIGKKLYTDLDSSIGNLTARLMRKGKITQPQAMQVRDMLKARFQGGERGMSAPLAATRNLTNTALLGNVASAATQVGDSLMVIAHHGFVPAVQSLYEAVRGRSKITPKDLGLINHVAEELSELGWTGRALHTTMRLAGFHAIDMFGKRLNMNAALIKNAKLVRTPKGEAAFRAKYEPAFGEETGRVIEDLKARRMSPEIEELAFNELSDSQPISKAELPQMYLEHPNGRILYQLKTYMMKQADVVRREVVQEMASGEPRRIAKGAKKLMILGSMYALANVPGDIIKDWIEGRNSDPLSTPRLVENLLQTFGINRYSGERIMGGNVVGAVQDLVTPPVRVLQDIAQGSEKAVSYIPLAGRSFYNRYLGGNEKREISEKRSANRGKLPSERERLSPRAREYLREKNRDAQQKRRDAR